MVLTLHRYILRELVRVFGVAAVALTMMLSLGSILRPVQEYGVGPRQVVHLICYSLPIMLTFVLPIAALFAASLVYGRFASDNELDACRASGISLLTLIYPGLALAIIVAVANLVLSFHVMPVFVHRAQRALKADAKQILFRNIKRKGYYKLPPEEHYLIYADLASPQTDTLLGVVVVEVEGGVIDRITTAERAMIHFNPHRRFNEVQITAYNTYQMDAKGSLSLGLSSFTAEFGSLLGDDIKFKKLNEMRKIRDVDLTLFDPIAKLARRVHAQLTAELLAQDITARIRSVADNFYKLHSGHRFVEFSAAECSVSKEKQVELRGNVVVVEYDAVSKQYLRTLLCEEALLYIEGDELAPTLTMELYKPAWQQAGRQISTAAGRLRIRGLIIPQAVKDLTSEFRTENSLKAGELASQPLMQHYESGSKLEVLQRSLQQKIQKTLAEIEAETHSRLVFGIGCITVVLIGIGLGIIFKGGHLLSAFGASCVPAAVLIVCIMMGKNIAKNLGSEAFSGTVLMWAGVIFLSLFAAVLYRKLLKN